MSTLLDKSSWTLILSKIDGILIRGFDIIRLFPIRALRVLNHFRHRLLLLVREPRELLNVQGHVTWWIELFLYVLDMVGVGEVYETLADIIKFNTRPLTEGEKKVARKLFNKSINIRRIRVDEFAFFGPRSHKFAYVSGYTINSWGELSESLFVHELVHVWQYVEMGSVYIPRALKAQYSTDGYDYGGTVPLMRAVNAGTGLKEFNLEQQGDIVADYYRLANGHVPRWSNGGEEDIWIYEKLIHQLHSEKRNLVA